MRDLYLNAIVNALFSAPAFAAFYPLAWAREPGKMLLYGLFTGPFIAIPFAVIALCINLLGATAGAGTRLFGLPGEPIAMVVALWLAFQFGSSGDSSGLGDRDMLTLVSMLAVGTPWLWRSGLFGLLHHT